MTDVSVGQALAFAILVGVMATAGDLIASHPKRVVGVDGYPVARPLKDGLLDTFDSWIVVGATLMTWVTIEQILNLAA